MPTVYNRDISFVNLISMFVVHRRDTLVCKVCRMDDNEDWLGCDKCGQFFHASCLGLNFARALHGNLSFTVRNLAL